MKCSGAGHFPVCSQTGSLPSSASALYSQGQPERGRCWKLEGGRHQGSLGILSSLISQAATPAVFLAPQEPLLLWSQLPPGGLA